MNETRISIGLLSLTALLALTLVTPARPALSSNLAPLEPPFYTFPLPSGAIQTIAVDVDQDGLLDVLSLSVQGVSLSRGLSNGALDVGTLAASASSSSNKGMTVAELNGDGKLDVAITGGSWQTFLGDGAGHFTADRFFANSADCLLSADLNGDGWVDLVTIASTKVSVYRSGGYGGFYPPVIYPAGSGSKQGALGDLNADGRLDLIVVNSSGTTMSLFPGNGDATFGPRVDSPTPPNPSYSVIADYNEDGRPDVLVTSTGQDKVSFYPGAGAAGFGPRVDLPTGLDPMCASAEDFNQDGHLDILTSDLNSRTITVFLGDGAGGFPDPPMKYAAGAGPVTLLVADFSHDGHPDIVTSNPSLVALYSRGAGVLMDQNIIPAGNSPRLVVSSDLNGDGKADLVIPNATETGATLSVLLGNGNDTFLPRVSYATGTGAIQVSIGDVDNNGVKDLISANIDESSVSILRGLGDGTFVPAISLAVGAHPSSTSLGDLNGDGWLDLAVAHLFSGVLSVHLNDGTGSFGPPLTVTSGEPGQSVQTADINEDGQVDLVLAVGDGHGVKIFRGNGDGSFQSPLTVSMPSPGFAESFSMADLNSDGHLDLLVGISPDNDRGRLVSLLGDGHGGFAPPNVYVVPKYVQSTNVGDVDGDGLLDAITEGQTEYVAAFLHGNGDGTFAAPVYLGVPNPYGLCLADLNQDGFPDLAITNVADNTLTIMQNVSGVLSTVDEVPLEARIMFSAAPNPSSGPVLFQFDLPEAARIAIDLFDVSGSRLARLNVDNMQAGTHSFTWDGHSGLSRPLRSGCYFFRLSAGRLVATRQVVWLGR